MINKIEAIMNFYYELSENDDYQWLRWNDHPQEMTIDDANKYFIGVMLDQGQKASRAWAGGKHFVEHYFSDSCNFWQEIVDLGINKLIPICQYGYNGKSYAVRQSFRNFPYWLLRNALIMVEEFEADPRNIWNIGNNNLYIIYNNFKRFSGIGDALAKMASFILVRKYGIAGGIENRHCLSVKPDLHVCKVMHRMGISKSEKISDVLRSIDDLNLQSPADFDAAVWVIGTEYCKKTNPSCQDCPTNNVCNYWFNRIRA